MTERYRNWEIYPNDFIADPNAHLVTWIACHKDFDGEDANDNRCFAGPSPDHLRDEIDLWELDNHERVYDRTWVPCETCKESGSVTVGPLAGEEKLELCQDCGGYGGWFADAP